METHAAGGDLSISASVEPGVAMSVEGRGSLRRESRSPVAPT
jgi:hypothetical protein